jgi:SAM-dependent methyltransferase
MDAPASDNPWDWMQTEDARRMGEVIFDPKEQERWSRAVMLGGLPYMWRKKAKVVRDMVFDHMALADGQSVLVIGEALEPCAFLSDIRERIGSGGSMDVFDITEDARDAYIAGRRGRHGALATWQFDYTHEKPAEAYDCVAILQGVQHTDDWHETARELVRVLRPGGSIVLAEITFSPQMVMKAKLDMHLDYWLEKMFARMGWGPEEFPYYSPQQLEAAFGGLLDGLETFCWNGVECLWGRKPAA